MLIRAELKDFSLNMIFLANYVQSFRKTHYVCDFCFFSSRKRRKTSLPFLIFNEELLRHGGTSNEDPPLPVPPPDLGQDHVRLGRPRALLLPSLAPERLNQLTHPLPVLLRPLLPYGLHVNGL